MGWDAPWHWVVLAIIVIALFGYKKLPDASRALGRSLRIFKAEIKGMTEDDSARDTARTEPAALPEAVPPAAPTSNGTPPAAAHPSSPRTENPSSAAQ